VALSGKNRVLVREVNDQIREINAGFGDGLTYDLLCECSKADCVRRVVVPRSVYDELRRDEAHFLVSPEHAHPHEERIVSANGAFLVVAPATG
jgi:hypothetical protein